METTQDVQIMNSIYEVLQVTLLVNSSSITKVDMWELKTLDEELWQGWKLVRM